MPAAGAFGTDAGRERHRLRRPPVDGRLVRRDLAHRRGSAYLYDVSPRYIVTTQFASLT